MTNLISTDDFVNALSLAAADGLTKPADLLAVVSALVGLHPDHLPLVKSATDRVRASYRRIMDTPLFVAVQALKTPVSDPAPEVPAERIIEVPAALLAGYVAAGVSEETVQMLWVKHPYWLKMSLRVFTILVERGMIDSPDAFLVQTCRRKWFLHPNYDRNHKAAQKQATEARLKDETEELRRREEEGRQQLRDASNPTMNRLKEMMLRAGVKV
ncbi:hypothetical protein IHN63_00580 [Deinococcus sp. 6YEL10]|uniref:hypothetical protein n=1 Tax=Deinococcus sp. 6YEL10 TaxID=2745870 RepID=UPI001E43F8D8|nr:hypothetical protein [Deinococcus sp. 6YEL10]MCD0159795.1 hypothetical protein [Deinococcus sp. 6YEL10]